MYKTVIYKILISFFKYGRVDDIFIFIYSQRMTITEVKKHFYKTSVFGFYDSEINLSIEL